MYHSEDCTHLSYRNKNLFYNFETSRVVVTLQRIYVKGIKRLRIFKRSVHLVKKNTILTFHSKHCTV